MKKKTILVAAIAVMLVAALVVGGTLAYFTDTKSADNVFTVGNVSIDLNEQQKGEKGLEKFEQNKRLVPGTSSDGNAVSKIVTVTNTSKDNDAWVWVELKIPAYLVSNEYPTNESKNALHWNSYGCFNVEYNAGNYWTLATNDGIVGADHNVTDSKMVAVNDGLWNDYKYVRTETDANGNPTYVVIRTTMAKTLPAGKTSLPCLAQVYMDWRVTTSTVDGETVYNLPDGSTISTKLPWNVIVTAYAIQADGFETVDQAVAAYNNNGK